MAAAADLHNVVAGGGARGATIAEAMEWRGPAPSGRSAEVQDLTTNPREDVSTGATAVTIHNSRGGQAPPSID